MINPLQKNKPIFYAVLNGKLIKWDAAFVDEMVTWVNQATKGETAENPLFPDWEITFVVSMNMWLDRYIREGITIQMVNELNAKLESVRYQQVLKLSDSGEPVSYYVADLSSGIDLTKTAEYWFSHMLDVQMFGIDKPQYHHWMNLIIHLASSTNYG